jgi:membrane protease YdiL (CAAX protease family)
MKQKLNFTGIVIDILAIAFVFLLPHYGFLPIPFYYIVPVLVFVWLFLKRTRENFASLGFSFKRFELKSVFVGIAAAAILFAFMQYIFFPLLNRVIVLKPANLDDFKNIRGNFYSYILILIAGFVVGGFYEELVFHGFIFTRLEKLPGAKFSLPVSFILTNLIFGAYHFQLGMSGMINALFCGIAYHALFLKFGRNLWYSIFAHAFFDAIGLTYIYLGYW